MTTQTTPLPADIAGSAPQAKPMRRGDGGTYLVIDDGSDEFPVALRYAARIAQSRRGHVAILANMENPDFTDWGAVEAAIKRELRERCEASLTKSATALHSLTGLYPSLLVVQGPRIDAIVHTMKDNQEIVALVLATHGKHSSPGPLIGYFTGKGLSKLAVPVFVVPGNLDDEAVDRIA